MNESGVVGVRVGFGGWCSGVGVKGLVLAATVRGLGLAPPQQNSRG